LIIAHLTSSHKRNDTRIYYKECKSLARDGHKVYLLVADGKGSSEEDGVAIIDVVHKGEFICGRFRRLVVNSRKIYKRALELKADIYHFHDPEMLPWGWFLKKKGNKVIYDIHEDYPRHIFANRWLPGFLLWFLCPIIEILENKIAKRMDVLICATPKISARFEKIHEQVETICNYPILNEFPTEEDIWSKKERAVCFIGNISHSSGLFEMVAAAEFIDGLILLAGNVLSKEELALAKEMPGWNKVKLLGFLDRQEVYSLLKKSMAGLLLLQPIPNSLESLPIKMFEYMSAAIPVIASDFPYWENLLEGNGCGIRISPKESQSVAEVVNWLFDNPENARQMGLRGRKLIEKNYSWEKESKKMRLALSKWGLFHLKEQVKQ